MQNINKLNKGELAMNLLNKCTTKEINLLEKAGVHVENKEYTEEELRIYERNIEEYIMNHSSKNGDIPRLSNEYNGILNILIKGN